MRTNSYDLEYNTSHFPRKGVVYSPGKFFAGTLFLDMITVGNVGAGSQPIGAAAFSEGFDDVDGVLG